MAGQVEERGGAQRGPHERMTADQFIWWLRGFLAGAVGTFDPATVREQLDKVNVPAPYIPPAPTPVPINPSPLRPFCGKCGANLTGLGAVVHNC